MKIIIKLYQSPIWIPLQVGYLNFEFIQYSLFFINVKEGKMNNRKIFFGTLLALLTLAVSPVYAMSVWDFADMADNPANPNYMPPGERGDNPLVLTVDGIVLNATGFQTASPHAEYFAYLDAGNAGLGVCKDISGTGASPCQPSNDDNVTEGETLKLSFDRELTLTETTFVNGSHGTTFADDATVDISIDGGAVTTYALVNLFEQNLTGTMFSFANNNTEKGNEYQFYINTATTVPLPAAAWLFISGLFSLGFFRKKVTGDQLAV